MFGFTKNIRNNKIIVLPILLAGSLIFNIILLQQFISMSKELNLTWSNSTSHFAQVANRIYVDLKRFEDGEKGVTLEKINYILQSDNQQLIQEHLESIGNLPYAGEIVPFETREKIRILGGYQTRVLHLMKNELEKNGEVSSENIERVKALGQAWHHLLGMLSAEENKIDPFAPIFLKEKWKQAWEKAKTAFETVELVPLPESYSFEQDDLRIIDHHQNMLYTKTIN